jgi:hypothetical protein
MEYKFRAWDKIHKVMYHEFGQGSAEVQALGVNRTLQDYMDDPNWEIMIYTGIKDMYGVEIYTGDILQSTDPDAFLDYGDKTVVSFYKGAFYISIRYDHIPLPLYGWNFLYKPNVEGVGQELYNHLQDFHKIGNYYENEDLLRKEDGTDY